MSSKQNFAIGAKLKRAQYQAYVRSVSTDPHDAPTPASSNEFLPPLEPDGPYYLPSRFFNVTQKWLIPAFDLHDSNTNKLVKIDLTLDGTPGALAQQYEDRTPFDPPPPIPVDLIMAAKDAPGDHEVSMRLNYGGNIGPANKFIYTVQSDPQNFNERIGVPTSVETTGMGPEDFEGGKTIPLTFNYANKRLGDTIECRMGVDTSVTEVIGAITFDATNIGQPIVFQLTADHVKNYDGKCLIFVTGHTYPGVVATPSATKEVFVFKKARPVVVGELDVPQIIDPLVDILEVQQFIDQVRAGLKTVYTNFDSTLDEIVVSIDGVPQPAQRVTAIPFLNVLDPVALLALGNNRSVKLGYRILRHGFFFPTAEIFRDVKVDTRMPLADFDPADPNPPDKTALKPWIMGPVSQTRNKLTAADKISGQDVDGFVPVHSKFNLGDSIQFYYDGQPVPAPGGIYDYPATGTPPNPIPFKLKPEFLWGIADDPTMQIQYVVTHLVNNNESQSLTEYADVKTQPIVLNAATFTHIDSDFGIICDSLRTIAGGEVVAVCRIPGDSRMGGLEVTYGFTGYSDASGDDAYIIDDSEFEDKITPTPAQASAGFDVFIPVEYLIATLDGWGRINYAVTIAGERPNPKGNVEVVNMSYGSSGATCDLTKPIPYP